MLDKIEYGIARKLSERHHYPYGQEIYMGIFRNFSHFPLKMEDLGIKGEGTTITFLALVILRCFSYPSNNLFELYKSILDELNQSAAPHFPQDITVETFLGCILYFYHPVEIKNILNSIEIEGIFDEKQIYEFELKKQTILMFSI